MINDPADLTPIAEPAATETPEERSGRQARELKAIAAVGVWLIHDLQDQAQKPHHERPSHAELSLAYGRYARAVRLTHALENRLWDEAQSRARLHPPMSEPKPKSLADKRRHMLRTVVEETAQAKAEREPRFDADETYERAERLIDEELEDEDITGRPIHEVYALICKSLGVKPDWALWDPRQWRDPQWGLTEQELSDEACPEGPPKRITDDWPEPGTLMPLPSPASPSGSSRGPIGEPAQTLGPRDKPEDDGRDVRDGEPKAFAVKAPP